MDAPTLRLTSDAAIATDALRFTASTASGPGGQQVDKVSTRVPLLFDLDGSPSLSEIQKARIHAVVSGGIGKDGVLRVVVQTIRSQLTNKELVVRWFVDLPRGRSRSGRCLARRGRPWLSNDAGWKPSSDGARSSSSGRALPRSRIDRRPPANGP